LCAIGSSLFAQLKTAKLISTFDEKDKHYIDTVYCKEKYETTFILPPGRAIKKVVTGDPDEWEIVGKYGGRIVSVKPLQEAGQTSLTIITGSLRIYKFNIVNIDTVQNPGFDVMAIVEIKEKNSTMEVIKREAQTGDDLKLWDEQHHKDKRLIEQKKEELLLKLNYDYRWKDKYFEVENVYDDGIFTYIVMTKTKEFPAVYISSGKKGKKKSIEPIKYVVKPGMIVIHRIIESKENILLRLGSEKDKKEADIYRKKKRR
jgi:type IV secretory pathway VirB9-like protein